MKITRHGASGWHVQVEPNELAITATQRWPHESPVGWISLKGALQTIQPAGAPRTWSQLARYRLEDARNILYRRGELALPASAQRSRREEQATGDFITELDDGRVGRFHSFRSESPQQDRGTPLFRPGAADWAEAELEAGRASHADMFRGPIPGPERMIIYRPTVLPPRGGHPALVVGEVQHLPIHSWSRQPNGRITTQWPRAVATAYDLKRQAMALVDRRVLEDEYIHPADIGGAWEVASDAFLVAGLPTQGGLAHRNARWWHNRATVSSRRPRRR